MKTFECPACGKRKGRPARREGPLVPVEAGSRAGDRG